MQQQLGLKGQEMFPYFPFVATAPIASGRGNVPSGGLYPKVPKTQVEIPKKELGIANTDTINSRDDEFAFVEFLRAIISSFAVSLTAWGSQSNALFAQIAAALATERAARDTAVVFGTKWPDNIELFPWRFLAQLMMLRSDFGAPTLGAQRPAPFSSHCFASPTAAMTIFPWSAWIA